MRQFSKRFVAEGHTSVIVIFAAKETSRVAAEKFFCFQEICRRVDISLTLSLFAVLET